MSLAEALAGKVRVPELAGEKRVHKLDGDGESKAATLRERVLGILMVDAGTQARKLAEILDEDVENVRNACSVLRAAGLVTSVKGDGYYLASGVPSRTTPGAPEPVITPFLESKRTKGETMPRKPKAAAAADAKREKRKYTKRLVPGPKKPKHAVGAARFSIDDRGGMTIEDGQQSIHLEADDVGRLDKFREQTKGLRK